MPPDSVQPPHGFGQRFLLLEIQHGAIVLARPAGRRDGQVRGGVR